MNRVFVYSGNGKLVYLNFNEEERLVRIGNEVTQFKLIPVQLITESEIEVEKSSEVKHKKRIWLNMFNNIMKDWKIEDINSYLINEMQGRGLKFKGEITAEEDIKTFQMI